MPHVEIDPCDWDTIGEAEDVDCHTGSNPMESRLSKRNIMQTQYSSSSQKSSIYSLDERSTSPDSSGDNRERCHSIDEPNPSFVNLRLDNSFARRKASTCSDTSSIDSTSLSFDGGSDSERNSTSYPTEYDTVPGGTNKFDDIIDKIVGLRFTKSPRDSETSEEETCLKRTESSTARSADDNEDNIVGNVNDVNGNYESDRKSDDSEYWDDVRTEDNDDRSADHEEHDDDDDDDGHADEDDLVERGPVRPPGNNQSHHGKPYSIPYYLNGTTETQLQNQLCMYETTAQQILENKHFSEKINPCLDKLSDYSQSSNSFFNIAEQTVQGNLNSCNGWASPETSYADNGTPNSNVSLEDVIKPPIPSIVLNNPGEASLLEMLASGGFQAAQALSDTASVQNLSPGAASSENWPDSPSSSCNVLSSRSQSRASSRAQSPGSSANIGSPLSLTNIGGSPAESRRNRQSFRVGQALSSSESSNLSYADTPSPTNYQCGLDHRDEEHLRLDFESFSTWCPSCVSSGTVVNSFESTNVTIDSSELQLVEEIIRSDQSEKKDKMKELQVVPKSQPVGGRYETCQRRVSENDIVLSHPTITRNSGQMRTIENVFDGRLNDSQSLCKSTMVEQSFVDCEISQLGNTGMLISNAHNNIMYPDLHDEYYLTYSDGMQSNVYNENPLNSTANLMDFESSMENFLASHYPGTTTDINNSTTVNSPQVVAPADPVPPSARLNDLAQINGGHGCFANTWQGQGGEPAKSTFNDFQIPETVSSYRQNRSRRTSERNIAPWPSLNLPQTGASERLKASLDPREVERAMAILLMKPTEKLLTVDKDGYTELMCLVGHPIEFEKNKSYLVPLVERLGNLSGALTMTNHRNKDALYLAAMNCPQTAYITGYLAAVLLQKGFDVSQRLYNTKGDTLVHAIAARGDTHGAVLAELLSLKTIQGNAVFDLSKRNYDGRTPLHVAVESHGQQISAVSSIGTVRLLLENGANPKIKETKCGDTALHMAVSLCCDPTLVKALLKNNGHEAVNIPNYNNNTPVHMAAALSNDVPIKKHMEICIHLIRAGGLTNIQNRQGKTPLALVSPERKDVIRNIFHKKI